MKKRLKVITILASIFLVGHTYAADELFGPCLSCDLEGVKTAIANGADVNTVHSSSGQSSLAYSYHCPEVTKYLIEQGAKPDAGSYPALISASSVANYEVMKMLLEAGANPNIDIGGESPLYKVVQMTNCADCAQLLFENGADKKTSGKQYANLAGVYASFGKTQADQKTAMNKYAATLKNYGVGLGEWYTNPSEKINAKPIEMMKVLVKNGVDINAKTKLISVPENDGEPALFTAINVGNEEIIMSFINNGVDYNATYPIYNPKLCLFNIKGGYTPLMYAALSGKEWLVEELLKKTDLLNPSVSGTFMAGGKNDPIAIDIDGLSAIYLAVMGGNLQIVKQIADSPMQWNDFVLNLKGRKFAEAYGSKPAAYTFGNLKGVKKNTLKYTPSLWATFSEQVEMAEYLKSKGL